MIDSSDKSNIVIILPQNITFKYYWGYNGKGNNKCKKWKKDGIYNRYRYGY